MTEVAYNTRLLQRVIRVRLHGNYKYHSGIGGSGNNNGTPEQLGTRRENPLEGEERKRKTAERMEGKCGAWIRIVKPPRSASYRSSIASAVSRLAGHYTHTHTPHPPAVARVGSPLHPMTQASPVGSEGGSFHGGGCD